MGSSQSDDAQTDHIPVGYVRKAHGIRGDVVVRGLVDDAAERFVEGMLLTTGETPSRTLRIVAQRTSGSDYLLRFEGIESRDEAEALVGCQFVIDKSQRRELEQGEWWVEDLVGCEVVDTDGRHIGLVADVVSGAAQDRLVVETPDGKRAEVPFVDPLVPEVDMVRRRITVDLPIGLVE